VHGEAVKDRGGEGGVAEEAASVAEPDVRGHGGGDTPVPSIHEVVQGVSSGRLIATLLDLAEADSSIIRRSGRAQALEAAGIGAISEAGVELYSHDQKFSQRSVEEDSLAGVAMSAARTNEPGSLAIDARRRRSTTRSAKRSLCIPAWRGTAPEDARHSGDRRQRTRRTNAGWVD